MNSITNQTPTLFHKLFSKAISLNELVLKFVLIRFQEAFVKRVILESEKFSDKLVQTCDTNFNLKAGVKPVVTYAATLYK